MSKYYFHFVGTADDVALDEEGAEFPHDAAAMEYAMNTARGLVAEFVSDGEAIDRQRIDVMDGSRRVGSVELEEVVRIRPENGS
jgi:Domain of unknown function (DUF6894)